jgi:hypothetical protein
MGRVQQTKREFGSKRQIFKGAGNYFGLAGEFLVLSELALRHLDGTHTLGRTKEIDILVLNRRTGRTFKLEVKTTKKGVQGNRIFGPSYAWMMDVRHGRLRAKDLVYCFVLLDPKRGRRQFFLVPSGDVAAYIRWNHRYFLRRVRKRRNPDSPIRVFRIPAQGARRNPVPSSWRNGRWQRWEDNWAIFGPMPG